MELSFAGSGECSNSPEPSAGSCWRGEGERDPQREGKREARGEGKSYATAEEVSWLTRWSLGDCVDRSQEEVASLKRKLDKYKSREWASSSDEVLLEEIRTYKVEFHTGLLLIYIQLDLMM